MILEFTEEFTINYNYLKFWMMLAELKTNSSERHLSTWWQWPTNQFNVSLWSHVLSSWNGGRWQEADELLARQNFHDGPMIKNSIQVSYIARKNHKKCFLKQPNCLNIDYITHKGACNTLHIKSPISKPLNYFPKSCYHTATYFLTLRDCFLLLIPPQRKSDYKCYCKSSELLSLHTNVSRSFFLSSVRQLLSQLLWR